MPEIGKGRIVAESTSPVGKGTAGLLLINGTPLNGNEDGITVAGGLAPGEAAFSRGPKGQWYAGGEDEAGTGPARGDGSGDGPTLSCGAGGSTSKASFWPSSHGLSDLLSLKEK